jgi:hypothetical protein
MREIAILRDALIEARRITREAMAADVDAMSKVSAIIAANKRANDVLMRARAESQLATPASILVAKSLHAK